MSNVFRLKVVPTQEPDPTRTIVDFDGQGTRRIASADPASGDLYCGQCGALMVTAMTGVDSGRFVIRCKLCRAFNDPTGINLH